MVKKNAIYYDKTQQANFHGKLLFQATNLLLAEMYDYVVLVSSQNQKQISILHLIFHRLTVVL